MVVMYNPRAVVYQCNTNVDDTRVAPVVCNKRCVNPCRYDRSPSLGSSAKISFKLMKQNLRVLAALLQKEVLLMRRNPLIPRIILLMPIMVMLVTPLVASFDVKNVGVAVVDTDNTQLSRRIVADMSASEWLVIDTVVSDYREAMTQLEDGKADVILSLPRGIEKDPGLIDVSANGVNATKGVLGAQYAAQSAMLTMQRWRAEHGESMQPDNISVLNLYNPTLNFKFYMIPALVCLLIVTICGFLPALNLVSEKQTGTIEAMNVTPVGRMTFVLSKLIPFWIAGMIVLFVGMITSALVYDLVPAGSIATIALATILFSFLMSGFGVTVANYSSTLMQTIFVMYAIIMIMQLMGGLFTPVSSMPMWAQNITYVIPTRYYIDIMRAVYLKGSSVTDLGFEFVCLTAIAVFTCLLAAITYRKRN